MNINQEKCIDCQIKRRAKVDRNVSSLAEMKNRKMTPIKNDEEEKKMMKKRTCQTRSE